MNVFDNNSALRPWEDKDEQAVKRKEEEEEEVEMLKEKRSSGGGPSVRELQFKREKKCADENIHRCGCQFLGKLGGNNGAEQR